MHIATNSAYRDEMSSAVENDSISAAVAVIGDRWSLLVMRGVFRGLHRFGELRDDLGIASNLLTDRLCRLVEHGVLEKVPYQDRPVRFEYRLTDAGRDLSPVLVAIMQWGHAHSPGAFAAPLVHTPCDTPIVNITQCTGCNQAVDAHEIRRADQKAEKP